MKKREHIMQQQIIYYTTKKGLYHINFCDSSNKSSQIFMSASDVFILMFTVVSANCCFLT